MQPNSWLLGVPQIAAIAIGARSYFKYRGEGSQIFCLDSFWGNDAGIICSIF